MPHRDVISWNTMIFGYSGIGNMGFAQFLFDSMPERDVVSWNSLLSCYLQNGIHRKSIDVFVKMRLLNIPHDYATFSVALKACTGIEDYGLGLQLHCLVIQMGFESDVVTGTALVDMYSTCYVRNDRFIEGLKLYKAMLKEGTQLHAYALKTNFGYDSIVGTATLD
ncbi:pentatricopeptide repeat-containing protein, partial [Trifolium pratense]